jgi:hypothetical protein
MTGARCCGSTSASLAARRRSPPPWSAPSEEGPRFAWSGALCGYLGLGRQPVRRPPGIRTDSRAEQACDALRRGCSPQLLLYLAAVPEPWSPGLGISSYNSDLRGAMEIRTPGLLHACRTLRLSPHVAGRGPAWLSPAASVAVCGLAWPCVAPRWLPAWLPNPSLRRGGPATEAPAPRGS